MNILGNFKTIAAAAVVASAGVFATTANAVTITITSTSLTVDCSGAIAQSCQGYTAGGANGFPTSMGILSNSAADLYTLANNDPTTEAQALDILIDGLNDDDFTGVGDFTRANEGVDYFGGNNHSFNSTAQYIAFKIGGGQLAGSHFFLKLLAPGTVNLVFDKNGQQGGGLSHYTEFGTFTPATVPLPAAGWLMIAGLGGLGLAARRKRKAA